MSFLEVFMTKKKQLKKNSFIWWKRIGNSLNQNIDCPCVVTKISKNKFKVISLDDFVESDWIPTGSCAFEEEMELTTRKKVISFLEKKSKAIEERVKKAQAELKNATQSKKLFLEGKKQIKESLE